MTIIIIIFVDIKKENAIGLTISVWSRKMRTRIRNENWLYCQFTSIIAFIFHLMKCWIVCNFQFKHVTRISLWNRFLCLFACHCTRSCLLRIISFQHKHTHTQPIGLRHAKHCITILNLNPRTTQPTEPLCTRCHPFWLLVIIYII